ncbi:MAG: hypothetical protein HY243_05875 [Proteobacteria bacterium]|nr:hypothetical protein [Pseudomonadota bacterium]
MVIRVLLLLVGLFQVVNGLWMLTAPENWYAGVPGVTLTGPINLHFITDIGLAFLASGAGMMLGARKGLAAFALAGATWPALHALFHIWGWFEHGFPMDTKIVVSEIVGVVGVSALGLAAAWLQARKKQGVV